MMRKGLWSPDEDERLVQCIAKYVNGSWSDIARKAGLDRCGKSCRRRWMNHLRPDLKRGRFSMEEINLIIQLQEVLGNRWSDIASHLEGRTDNDVKNLWNTQIKKRLPQLKSQFKLLQLAADHHHHGRHDIDQYLHEQTSSPAVLNDQAASAFHMIDICHGGITDQASGQSSMFSTQLVMGDGSSAQEEFLANHWDNAALVIHDPLISSSNVVAQLIQGYNHDNGYNGYNGYEIINQSPGHGSKQAADFASVMIGSSSNCASTAYSMAITGTDQQQTANNTAGSSFTNQSWQDSIRPEHGVDLVPVKTEQCTAGEINKPNYLPMTFSLKHIASDQAGNSSTNKCISNTPLVLNNNASPPTGKIHGSRFSNHKSDAGDGSSLVDMVMSCCLERTEINRSAHDQLIMTDSDQFGRVKDSIAGAAVPAACANSCSSNYSVESNSNCGLLGNYNLSGTDDADQQVMEQDCVSTLTVINNHGCKAAISSATDEDDDDDDHPARDHDHDLQHLHRRQHHHHRPYCSDHHQQIVHNQTTSDHHAPITAVAADRDRHPPDHNNTLDHLANMQSGLWELVSHDQITNDSIGLIHSTACTIDAHYADWHCNNDHSFVMDNSINYNVPPGRNSIFCEEGL